jgi:hypothetical protein
MKEDGTESASGAKISNIAASEAPGRERRMTGRRKQEAVLRVLRGEPLETVAREIGATVPDLSGWRDRSLEGGAASLKSRPRDDRDDRIVQLQAKLGEITMDNELLSKRSLAWRPVAIWASGGRGSERSALDLQKSAVRHCARLPGLGCQPGYLVSHPGTTCYATRPAQSARSNRSDA